MQISVHQTRNLTAKLLVILTAALILSGCQAFYPRSSGTFGDFDTADQPFVTAVNVPRADADITLDYTVQVDEGTFTVQVIDPAGRMVWEKTHRPGAEVHEAQAVTTHTDGTWVVCVRMQGFSGKYSLGVGAPGALNWAVAVEILLDVGAAFVIAWLVQRRSGEPWRIFGIGTLFFGLCQLAELPLAIGIAFLGQYVTLSSWMGGLIVGLIAGVFEETTRYLAMRFTGVMRRHRTWSAGVLYGAGHGGLENITVGLGVAMLALLTLLPATYLPEAVQPFLAARPWYLHLYGGLSRVMALALHIGLTLLVLQVFTQGKLRYLWIAMAWHAWIDFSLVGSSAEIGWLWMSLVVLYTCISLSIIIHYRRVMKKRPL